jgi:hypothetical protein
MKAEIESVQKSNNQESFKYRIYSELGNTGFIKNLKGLCDKREQTFLKKRLLIV